MDPAIQPYGERAAVNAAFAEHVNRGKVQTYEALHLIARVRGALR